MQNELLGFPEFAEIVEVVVDFGRPSKGTFNTKRLVDGLREDSG